MTSKQPDDFSQVQDRIQRALHGLRFGSVEITVHHGRVVQIERREKLRLDTQDARFPASKNPESDDR